MKYLAFFSLFTLFTLSSASQSDAEEFVLSCTHQETVHIASGKRRYGLDPQAYTVNTGDMTITEDVCCGLDPAIDKYTERGNSIYWTIGDNTHQGMEARITLDRITGLKKMRFWYNNNGTIELDSVRTDLCERKEKIF